MAIRSQLTNAFRIRAGDSATISPCQRASGPAARAVASTAATAHTASRITVKSKNSRPLIATSMFLTSQAAACIAPPIRTGYSTGCPV